MYVGLNEFQNMETGQLAIYAGEGKEGQVLYEYSGIKLCILFSVSVPREVMFSYCLSAHMSVCLCVSVWAMIFVDSMS